MDLIKKPVKLIINKQFSTCHLFSKQRFKKHMIDNLYNKNKFSDWDVNGHDAENVRLFGKIDKKADWEKVLSRMHVPVRQRYMRIPAYRYLLRIAAIMVLAMGLSYSFYRIIDKVNKPETTFVSHAAHDGLKEISLPDGSQVSLNQGSTLTYNNGFSSSSREVVLSGEALFNVKSDASHPFRVFTGESVVEVTGTSFAITQEAGSVKVTVLSGSVLLSTGSNLAEKISISANQSGYLLTDNTLKLENKIEVNDLSWKTGHLVFDETPIDSALIDIAHHFRKNLSFESGLSEEITAEFQNQPLGEILEELSLVAGLKFDTTGTALIVRK